MGLQLERLEDRSVPSANVVEMEPNNAMAMANLVMLGFDAGETSRFVVHGSIAANTDRDWFEVRLGAGDVIGANR